MQKKILWPDNHNGVCDHSPKVRHPGVQSQVGLRMHHHEQASRGDGIPAKLFQLQNDDAVKVLHSICQQI